ncbi:MAG: Abi family protein [Bacilli bacterium]|nr:Abi family protein [Bacilli bacterium]
MEKQFRSLDEQIDILKSKGLIIEDEVKAKEILLRENYFFINGYRILLMNSYADKNFIIGSTFRELHGIFLFDRHIRNILFKYLMIIENQLKSVISYQLSLKYGYRDKEYLNPKNFTSDRMKHKRVRDIIDKMKRQIRVNGTHHMATMHYINNYGYIPLWVLVKVLSFGIVCELYLILKKEDQVIIADIFGINTDYLENFLPILSNYRNLCAHEDIVYEHRTEKGIVNTPYHEELNIPKMDNEYIYGKNDIFSVLIILKYLLIKDDFRLMMREIEYEIEKLDGIVNSIPIDKILDRMGIPKNYMDLIDL